VKRTAFIKGVKPEPHLVYRGQHVWNQRYSKLVSVCLLEIYTVKRRRIAIAYEIPENTGPSITNAAENLWNSLKGFNGLELDYTFETHDGQSFDRVEINNGQATWEHVGSLNDVLESIR
jgi:hypothetical protein